MFISRFFLTVVLTSDNSLFTCYTFIADHNSEYRIVLEPGNIMKGSRNQAADSAGCKSEISDEPVLRPITGGSRYSNNRTVSPTFDMTFSPNNNGGMQSATANFADDPETLRAMLDPALNNELTPTITHDDANSRLSSTYSRALEYILFPSSETMSGLFSLEVLKILQRWFRCHGWPTSHHLVNIPESFRR